MSCNSQKGQLLIGPIWGAAHTFTSAPAALPVAIPCQRSRGRIRPRSNVSSLVGLCSSSSCCMPSGRERGTQWRGHRGPLSRDQSKGLHTRGPVFDTTQLPFFSCTSPMNACATLKRSRTARHRTLRGTESMCCKHRKLHKLEIHAGPFPANQVTSTAASTLFNPITKRP